MLVTLPLGYLAMNASNTDPPARLTMAEFNRIVAATNEADTLFGQRQFERARQILEGVVSQKPDYVRPWCMLGVIHSTENRPDEAVSCFAKAHYLCPLNAAILLDLAKAQKRSMLGEATLVSLEKCNQIAPGNVDILILLGDQYWMEGDLDRSARAFEDALNVDGSNPKAMLGLAQAHQDMGDTEAAVGLYRKILEQPDTEHHRKFKVQATYSLADMGEDISEHQITLYADTSEDETAAKYLDFAFACVYVNLGRHERAWHHLVEANRQARELGQVTTDHYLKRYALSLEYANATVIPTSTPGDTQRGPQLIYIAGASRSGKTTLEHCLAHNAQVQPSYEMATIDRAVLRVAQVLGMPNVVDPWFMDDVPDDVLRNVFMDYISGLSRKKQHLTNTNPSNIRYIGLIARLVPSAKFIFVKRSKADQMFRIFLYNYNQGNRYSTDLTSIKEYIDWYEDMIDVWASKIPNQCKIVTYEEMVEDPNGTIDSIARFTNLEIGQDGLHIVDDRGCAEPFREFLNIDCGS
jgi:tetratricopeptide (TPR) repeat protein